MDLFTNLTDDQFALLGCFGAIIASATVMSLSYFVGPARKAQRVARQLPHVERMKQQAQDDQRKAA